MVRALSIIALCIGAAVVYGLIHDQITIRVSPEYFTVLHPLVRPVGLLLIIMACCAAISGMIGYQLAIRHVVVLDLLPSDQEVRAIAAWFTHLASYGVGIVGGLVVAVWAYICRGKSVANR